MKDFTPAPNSKQKTSHQPAGDKIDRRKFLRKLAKGALASGVVAGMPVIVPRNVLGRGVIAPSDQLTLGFIGCGGMGGGLLSNFMTKPEVRVLAVCDVDQKRVKKFKKRIGKHCDTYSDYRNLVLRKDIDAVVIATPDHWHALNSIAAMETGKDVYCEKPLTLYVAEGREMVRTARQYGSVFQTGSMQRSDDNFRRACEIVRSGQIGRLVSIKTGIGEGPVIPYEPTVEPPQRLDWNFWLGPAPFRHYSKNRCHYQFRWFWDYSGGKVTDWGAHHNDIAQWGAGMEFSGPVKVKGTGVLPENCMSETFTTFDIHYTYDNGVTLHCTSQGENGITFYGTEGEVFVARGVIKTTPHEISLEPPGPDYVHLYRSNDHHQNWLDCIKTRQKPICDVEIGHRSATVCHIGNIAMRLGRELEWDPANEAFVDDPNANRWLQKPMRKPWTL